MIMTWPSFKLLSNCKNNSLKM